VANTKYTKVQNASRLNNDLFKNQKNFSFPSWLVTNYYSATPVRFLRSNRRISAHWCTLPGNPADRTFWFRRTLRPSKSTVLSSATSADRRNRPENLVERIQFSRNATDSRRYNDNNTKNNNNYNYNMDWCTRQESFPPFGFPAHITRSSITFR